MRVLATVLLMLGMGLAQADVLRMPQPAQHSGAIPAILPQRGMSMKDVIERFGQPRVKHPTVGGHAPLHPPITRWDYSGYSVFFERSTVLDTVVPGHPPRLYHTSQLETAH